MQTDLEKVLRSAPRPISRRAQSSWATRALWPLPSSSKIARKALRSIYGKELKHMTKLGAAFQLKPTHHSQVWDIFWKGKKLGKTHPFPPAIPQKNIFILATGPSVKEIDLSLLHEQLIFGVNGTIAITKPLNIAPDYYACFDYKFFRDRMHLVKETVNSGAHCFFSAHGISLICQNAPELLTQGKISLLETVNRYYGLPSLPAKRLIQACQKTNKLTISTENPKLGWSHDIALGVFDAKTIPYVACQIANSLRASNVYILGMDLGSSGSQPIRAYESGPNAMHSSLEKDFENSILPSFSLMAKETTTSTFWNLSPNSRLPHQVMPKITFTEAIS